MVAATRSDEHQELVKLSPSVADVDRMERQSAAAQHRVPATEDAQKASSQGLSSLAARILDQLSITSWVPSAVLVLALALLGNLVANDGGARAAMVSLLSMGFGQLAAVFITVAVATVLTQAFEFESIRLLEGYWGVDGVAARLANRSRAHYRRRFAGLHRAAEEIRGAAANSAVAELRRRAFDGHEVTSTALEKYADAVFRASTQWRGVDRRLGGKLRRRHRETQFALADLSDDHRNIADAATWEMWADPDLVARFSLHAKALRSMPLQPHRVLPTRLGNVLRSYEDRVAPPGSMEVERFVQRRVHEIPAPLLVEHDQFRGRLDLYCSLVLVSVIVALAGLLLAPVARGSAAIWFVSWLSMSGLSYRAAVASAHGYGSVLLSIKEQLGADVSAPVPSSGRAADTPV